MSLVFVHGFLGGSAQWAYQAPLEEVCRIIPVDLPGFGLNAHLDPIDQIVDFASWCLGELTKMGVIEFDLLGHSMGGMIVQEMVRLSPKRIKNIILYGTGAIGNLPGRFESIEISMERARIDGASITARRITTTWFLERKDSKEFSNCATIAQRSRLPAILAGLKAMRDWSGLDNLPKINSRTLVLWGDRDRTYPWSQTEKLWQTIPDAQLAVIPNCSHAVHLEKPDLFNLLVKDFLKGSKIY